MSVIVLISITCDYTNDEGGLLCPESIGLFCPESILQASSADFADLRSDLHAGMKRARADGWRIVSVEDEDGHPDIEHYCPKHAEVGADVARMTSIVTEVVTGRSQPPPERRIAESMPAALAALTKGTDE
jgi:hypothetical protein